MPVVRRSNLPASSAAGAWEALVLDVGEPTRPALRVEAAGGGLLVLRRGDAAGRRPSAPPTRAVPGWLGGLITSLPR